MNFFQIGFGLFLGVVLIIAFYQRSQMEEKLHTERLKPGRKTALVEPLMLPIMLAVILVMSIIMDTAFLPNIIAVKSVLLFLHISVYYAALLLLLPLLRRIISARACATMWMLPTLLYCTLSLPGFEAKPLLLITLPRQWLQVFAWIWLAGFACIAMWQMISHFSYRRFLLRNSEEVTDEGFLSLWCNASRKHGVKADIPVFVSEAVSTPLTIGCFDRTMRLFLPKQDYTDEELALIFRHELRHILRADTRVKLFLGFYTAFCWFNPLAWIARRKASDDLELSCDEAVLSGAYEKTRRLYAELLLKNAGSSRGYTTCLSPAASSLRYRLRNVVNPAKRLSGAVVIGVAIFALFMSMGTLALADSGSTVQALVFDKAPTELAVDRVTIYNWRDNQFGYSSIYGWEEKALTEYLASLRVKRVYTGNYKVDEARLLYVGYGEFVDGELASLTRFELCNGLLFANIPYDDYGEITFILEDEIDWDYIESLLDFDAVNPDPAPFPPDMTMCFDNQVYPNVKLMQASKTILSVKRGDAEQEVNENLNDVGIGGVFGRIVTQVKLYFSYPPEGDYEIKVENWDRTDFHTVSSSELTDDVLPLAPYSAHYTVYGTFTTVRDTTYEMRFSFDVELPVKGRE